MMKSKQKGYLFLNYLDSHMKIYNTLSHKIEEFVPFEEKKVKIYVCGITPYDTTHLGHAFTYIFFDVLNRYLRFKGYEVIYTQNVTDINDRDNDILKRAKDQGTTWQNLSKFWTEKFLHDMHELNWIVPDNYLFASEHIPAMIDLIDNLLKNKIAYIVNGGVYLDISKDKDFGNLSGYSNEKMLSVAKEFDEDIDNPNKRNPLDITLWRPTIKSQSEHIPSFDSPYGPGRPGWHLECSAMSICSLGEQIDIHGGGKDLIYPHHEAEIAQSEGGAEKKPFSKFWLHMGIVSYNGQKMSKSIGNLVLVSDLLRKYSANAIRYLLLSNHYRSEWEFEESQLIEAEKKINAIREAVGFSSSSEALAESRSESSRHARTIDIDLKQFELALDDDMNTPEALKALSQSAEKGRVEEAKKMADILGFKFR